MVDQRVRLELDVGGSGRGRGVLPERGDAPRPSAVHGTVHGFRGFVFAQTHASPFSGYRARGPDFRGPRAGTGRGRDTGDSDCRARVPGDRAPGSRRGRRGRERRRLLRPEPRSGHEHHPEVSLRGSRRGNVLVLEFHGGWSGGAGGSRGAPGGDARAVEPGPSGDGRAERHTRTPRESHAVEVEVDHHLHDERHVGLVRLEDSVEDAAAQHRRSRAGDRPGVVQAKAREETLLGVVPVERFGANQGGVVDESALRSVVRARTDVGIDGVGFVGTGPRRGAGALRGANGHVHRRVQARREVSKKRPSLDGVAGEIVVVWDVKVRERAMQVKTRLLTAGGLAEYAHDRNLEEEVVGWRGVVISSWSPKPRGGGANFRSRAARAPCPRGRHRGRASG